MKLILIFCRLKLSEVGGRETYTKIKMIVSKEKRVKTRGAATSLV